MDVLVSWVLGNFTFVRPAYYHCNTLLYTQNLQQYLSHGMFSINIVDANEWINCSLVLLRNTTLSQK